MQILFVDESVPPATAYGQSLIHGCVTGQRRVTMVDLRRADTLG